VSQEFGPKFTRTLDLSIWWRGCWLFNEWDAL